MHPIPNLWRHGGKLQLYRFESVISMSEILIGTSTTYHTRTRSHQNHQIKITVFVCDSHCCRENMGKPWENTSLFFKKIPVTAPSRNATQQRCLKGSSVMRSHMGVPEDDGGVGQSGGNDHTVLCSNLRGASGTKVRETGDTSQIFR